MSSPVALIFGVGKNIGANVAKAFAADGYKVALASRSSNHGLSSSDFHQENCDLGDPSSIEKVFDGVRQKLGPPSVVIYNAATMKAAPDPSQPLSLPISDLLKTMDLNFASAYVAAQQAALAFDAAPKEHPKAFIYTGNRGNIGPIVPLLSLGVGKAAFANVVHYAMGAFEDKGYRFYYADERAADGQPVYSAIDGPAHAEFYLSLAKGETDVPWLATFVKGKGYVNFKEDLNQKVAKM